MFKMIKRNKKGFTLTELIVVIAILGVLAAVVTPSVLGYLSDAKTSADATNLATLDGCAKRLVTNGTIDLGPSVTDIQTPKATIIAAIAKEVNPIPKPNDTTKTKWLLTRTLSGTAPDQKLDSVSVTQVNPSSVSESADQIYLN